MQMCIDMITYNLHKNMFSLLDGIGILLSGRKNDIVEELTEEQKVVVDIVKQRFKKGCKID